MNQLQEVVRHEHGAPKILSEHGWCHICEKSSMVTTAQVFFEGPAGMKITGGPQKKEYLKTEQHQRCSYCGVDPAKISLVVLKSLGIKVEE